ncbi:hypothetical protein BT69DRAFT_1346672, partial [Atractiella rhizophila]
MDPSYTSIDMLLSDSDTESTFATSVHPRSPSPLPPSQAELSSRRGSARGSPYPSGTNLNLATTSGVVGRASALSPPTSSAGSTFGIPTGSFGGTAGAGGHGNGEEEWMDSHHYRNSPLARKLGLKPASPSSSSYAVGGGYGERPPLNSVRYSYSSTSEGGDELFEERRSSSEGGRTSLSGSWGDWWGLSGGAGGSDRRRERKNTLPISLSNTSSSNSASSHSGSSTRSNSPTSTPSLLS